MKKYSLLLAVLYLILISSCDDDNNVNPNIPKEVPLSTFIDQDIKVEPNKSGIAPLTVTFTINPLIESNVQLRVLDDQEHRIQAHNLETGKDNTIDFIGLFPDTENLILLTFSDENGDYASDTFAVTTGKLPEVLPEVEIINLNEDKYEKGWNLCSFYYSNGETVKTMPYMFDKYGNIRHYIDFHFVPGNGVPIELTEENTLLFGNEYKIWETTLIGEIIHEVPVPSGWIHHDVIKINDGNYLVTANVEGQIKHQDGSIYNTVEDVFWKFHRPEL